jgi:hypothetical protein
MAGVLLAMVSTSGPVRSQNLPSTWQGARVRVLGGSPFDAQRAPQAHVGGRDPCIRLERGKGGFLSVAQYAGREGTIVTIERDGPVLRLDETAEEVWVGCGRLEDWFAFTDELRSARELLGKPVWVKGDPEVVPFTDITAGSEPRTRRLRNLDRLVVSRVEYGYGGLPYLLCGRVSGGEELCLPRDPFMTFGWYAFTDSLHPQHTERQIRHLLHFTDPQKANPGWSAATWQSIRAMRITVGMPAAAAALACGPRMIERGAMLDAKGANSGTIYACPASPGRFVIANGKVSSLR